jgi:phosphonate transport system substrate-binding protein
VTLIGGCRDGGPEVVVDPGVLLREEPTPRGREVRFAIGTMISPRETLVTYHGLAELIGRRIGHPVTIVQKPSYGETNDLLVRGEADFAFVCSGAYVEVHSRGVELLAAPVVRGRTTYRSLVIVPADSRARSVEDLRGLSVAYVDPLSFTGKLYLEALVAPLAKDGAPFFGTSAVTHAHTTSLDMLAQRRAQVAAVDSLVWDDIIEREPERARGLRVLHRSPEFGIPPFVTRPGLPDAVRLPLRKALLAMSQDPEGQRVLAALRFDRFELTEDRAYDGLRHVGAALTRSPKAPVP